MEMRVIRRYVGKVVIINHSCDFNNIKPSIVKVKIGKFPDTQTLVNGLHRSPT